MKGWGGVGRTGRDERRADASFGYMSNVSESRDMMCCQSSSTSQLTAVMRPGDRWVGQEGEIRLIAWSDRMEMGSDDTGRGKARAHDRTFSKLISLLDLLPSIVPHHMILHLSTDSAGNRASRRLIYATTRALPPSTSPLIDFSPES